MKKCQCGDEIKNDGDRCRQCERASRGKTRLFDEVVKRIVRVHAVEPVLVSANTHWSE